jgi:hypothetical protein
LTNLGATCYLNTLLQTLFHCIPFREAVYRFRLPPPATGSDDEEVRGRPEGAGSGLAAGKVGSALTEASGEDEEAASAGSKVVLELQRIFGRLDKGSKGAVTDTEDLVKLVGFERGEQQG